MSTTVKENYLKALFFLDQKDNRISITELSEKLAVSKPSANNMVKSLQEKEWVVYQKYKPLQLTEKGRKAAAKIIRKHRLTEMFLFEIMGFGWEEVHEIAEEIEHIDSEKLFARMDEMLKYPKFDPHGSPIPDKNGKLPKLKYSPLSKMEPGKIVKLVAIAHSSAQLLHFLNQRNIKLGMQINLIKIEPYDESCLVRIGETTEMVLSREVSEKLLVEFIEK